MCEKIQIHATMLKMNGKAVLIKGKSGCGKSDLALRLLTDKNVHLVADDVVSLFLENNKVYGKAPENLQGLLEVRGVGVVKMPYVKQATVDLVVNLVDNPEEIERMPKIAHENILGLEIERIDLYAKECSAPEKVKIKLNGVLVNDEPIKG
ncbi:MAG: HPr kinase/phosphatase C-terminal domain-containing protein [Alphaproteobacteria bacterium]|nr:HPr kinase/phosphatase C-terminal domain-containing protein [Alphaproteobacteria bacterium]